MTVEDTYTDEGRDALAGTDRNALLHDRAQRDAAQRAAASETIERLQAKYTARVDSGEANVI